MRMQTKQSRGLKIKQQNLPHNNNTNLFIMRIVVHMLALKLNHQFLF